MAKTLTLKIQSIFNGRGPSRNFGAAGQYQASIAIDPDMPDTDSSVGSSGFIRPVAMSKFSGTEVTGVPMWFITNPKTANTYLYANDGKVHTISSSFAMGTALNSGNALSASSGNGAEYYDNYIYLTKNVDVARYGPLNGSPSLVQDYWTSTLSLTAPTNTTYPSINGVQMPNHVMHRHTDDKNYFCDVTSGNQGILSYIKTSKTTVEGDTNSSSAYNALDFDHGVWPTTIESYGTDLAIALIEGTSADVRQKNAKLAFWDTTSSSYNKITDVEFPDPLITALKNVNGVLYVFSGAPEGGCRISTFAGGYTVKDEIYLEDTYPPLQGAVDHLLNRIAFGGSCTYPEAAGVVYALNSKNKKLGDGLHTILRATGSGANPWVTALKYVQNDGFNKVQPLIGWDDDTSKGLDKLGTTYQTSYFWSELFRIGQPFKVMEVRIPTMQAIAANMTLVPKIWVDGGSTGTALRTINSTNYPNSDRFIKQRTSVRGQSNLYLELKQTGTALLTVGLPIEIDVLLLGT